MVVSNVSFAEIFGRPYDYTDVMHNPAPMEGLNWKQMEAVGDVNLQQQARLFGRVVPLAELKAVLDDEQRSRLERAIAYLDGVEAGRIAFFTFLAGGRNKTVFIAFLDQLEKDEYNKFSRRRNPVVQENFATFLSNPDAVWRDVIIDVIQSGGYVDPANFPVGMPPAIEKLNEENRPAVEPGATLADRLASL